MCVSAVGIKQGIEQQEGKRQLDGASSQTMGPLLVYSGVQCDLTHTIQLKRIPIAIAWCVPWCICWSIPCAVQTFAGQPSILAE